MMDAWILAGLALAVLLAWLVPAWRRRRALAQPLPPEQVAVLARNVAQYAGMDQAQKRNLSAAPASSSPTRCA